MPDDSESGDELEFLSPEGEPAPEQPDTGASPRLRRSSRKRKSVANLDKPDMQRGSGSKKKRRSTGNKQASPEANMPKLPRTPAGEQAQAAPPTPTQQPSQTQALEALEALLVGMEGRLGSKIDTTNIKVDKALTLVAENTTALEDLELRMVDTEHKIDERPDAVEERLTVKMSGQVRTMVLEQLREAGFDPDLTAGALSTRTFQTTHEQQSSQRVSTYADAVTAPGRRPDESRIGMSKEEKQEEKFWRCRRSIRVWPLENSSMEALDSYLQGKLGLEADFLPEAGRVFIKLNKDPRAKVKNEAVVTFETKEVRDAVRARAARLANFREEAGMRLEVPDHLQKDFRSLMNLAYDLKEKNPDLKRNIKFDEEDCGLFMDIQMKKDGPWRRIKPKQAKKVARTRKEVGPVIMSEEDITGCLGVEAERE